MNKEIGSTYWLSPDKLSGLSLKSIKSPNIINENEKYVSTCRSAIGLILDELSSNRKVALLPAFTCESVLIPFINRGYKVFPYPIGLNLNINWNSFKKKLKEINPSVILIHPYFGFDTTKEIANHIQEIKQQGIIVIEDMTQSMFSSFARLHANYHVGSIRKWLPLPDGAFTTSTLDNMVNEEDKELVMAKIKAMTEKGNWILHGKGEKDNFRKDFTIAERILDSRERPFLMSSISRELYATADIKDMCKKRWNNYYYLERKIWGDKSLSTHLKAIFPPIVKNVCPFHFPILVKIKRKELQKHLANHNIYATVIWRCPNEFTDIIDNNAKFIYDNILCFHIDQRYNIDDMKYIVDSLKDYYLN